MELPPVSLAPYPEPEKTAYLRVVAAMAAADGQLAREELLFLQAFCEDSELPRRATARVLALARGADGYDLAADLRILQPSALASGLLRDLRALAEADDEVSDAEESLLAAVSAGLGFAVPTPTGPTPLRDFIGDELTANSKLIRALKLRMEAPDVTPDDLTTMGRQMTALTRNQQRITGAAMDRAHAEAQRRLDGMMPGSTARRRPTLTTSAILATLLGKDELELETILAKPVAARPATRDAPVSLLWRLLARFNRATAAAAPRVSVAAG
ncbi:MAG: TerB family tellurite resistance protein [Hymenobacteraceae bacterium]|nr:TerB family tellurite resistance protein [Hymenobacteraceae bacterium]